MTGKQDCDSARVVPIKKKLTKKYPETQMSVLVCTASYRHALVRPSVCQFVCLFVCPASGFVENRGPSRKTRQREPESPHRASRRRSVRGMGYLWVTGEKEEEAQEEGEGRGESQEEEEGEERKEEAEEGEQKARKTEPRQ